MTGLGVSSGLPGDWKAHRERRQLRMMPMGAAKFLRAAVVYLVGVRVGVRLRGAGQGGGTQPRDEQPADGVQGGVRGERRG